MSKAQASMGATAAAPGRPKQGAAPPGGSEAHAVASVGANGIELRVLKGVHAGARAPLADAAYLLGADLSCDFILSDPGVLGQHAELQAGPEGYVLNWLQQARDQDALASARSVVLAPGVGVAIGPTVIAVDAANAPWPADDQIVLAGEDAYLTAAPTEAVPEPDAASLARDPVSPLAAGAGRGETLAPGVAPAAAPGVAGMAPAGPSASRTPPDAAAAEPQAGAAGADATVPTATAVVARPSRSGSTRLWVTLAAVAVLLALLAAFVWQLLKAAPAQAVLPAVSKITLPSASNREQRERIAALLQTLGLAPKARIEQGPNGSLLVRGMLMSDEESEALSQALSRQSLRPLLRITSEQEVRQSVGESLARHAADVNATLKADYLGEGRFRIAGQLPDSAAREALLQDLKAEFPQVVAFESGIVVPQDTADKMLSELRAEGIADITGRWVDNTLQIQASLAQADLPRWEQALARVAGRYKLPFKAALSFQATPLAVSALPKAALANLPFRLQSVVSGETPYVVLGDGVKLMVGGSRQGWRLVEVDPSRVTFEAADARRVAVPR